MKYLKHFYVLLLFIILGTFQIESKIVAQKISIVDSTFHKDSTITVVMQDTIVEPKCDTIVYGDIQYGQASWYGSNGVPGIKHTDNYHGKKTANGERFNTWEFTAAHKTWKLCKIGENNHLVKVTNVDNGRSIIVRLTDRGPYSPGRIIDLSYAGKIALGISGGLGNVKIQKVEMQCN